MMRRSAPLSCFAALLAALLCMSAPTGTGMSARETLAAAQAPTPEPAAAAQVSGPAAGAWAPGPEIAAGERRWAVAVISVGNLREQPSYTAEMGSQILLGTPVEIVAEDGYWRQVVAPDPYRAWINELALAPMGEKELREYIAAPKWICSSQYSQVFREPSEASEVLCDLVRGCLVRRISEERFPQGEKACPYRTFRKVGLPDGRTGYVKAGDLAAFAAPASSPSAEAILKEAKRYLGVPYLWGGSSGKGFDCSGFVRHVYAMNGILLPRNASQQWRAGREVALKDLRPGDLLFFGTPAENGKPARATHVGIYLGDSRFIHASQLVRICSLRPEDADFYDRRPIGARRILGQEKKCPFRFGEPVPEGIFTLASSPWYF